MVLLAVPTLTVSPTASAPRVPLVSAPLRAGFFLACGWPVTWAKVNQTLETMRVVAVDAKNQIVWVNGTLPGGYNSLLDGGQVENRQANRVE